MVPMARVAVVDAGRLLPRHPRPAAGERRPVARPSATNSGWTGTTRRTASRRRPTTARSGFSAGQPHRRRAHRRRGGRGLHLAAPRRLGRAGTRHPIPPLAGLGRRFVVRAGRQPVDALLRRSATASRRATRTGRGCCTGGSPGSLSGLPEHGGRRLRAVLDRGGPGRCRSPPRWPASPSSPGRPASCRPSRRPTGRRWPARTQDDRGACGPEPVRRPTAAVARETPPLTNCSP